MVGQLLKSNDQKFIDSIDTFLFDCDGVLWHGDYPIPRVAEVLDKLRSLGKRVLFVTNNSTKSRHQYLQKFKELNMEAYVDEIFGTALASAWYLKHVLNFPTTKKVYVCGQDGMQEELDHEGIRHCGSSFDNVNVKSLAETGHIQHDPEVGAVLFGFDIDMNYKSGMPFSRDKPRLDDPAKFLGAGALLQSLTAPLGRQPVVVGKPESVMMDMICEKYPLDRQRTCMVGDTLRTDILFGHNGGIKTLLVLSGITSPVGCEEQEIQADYVIDSLANLF
ncbi:hypothetical protein HDU98_012118 [Podochytrium sp. JEL0797]|nr:hypothetical protein HDU98_012118 [Podochytrium sp. JEL0797]